jgi:hypothetical protein
VAAAAAAAAVTAAAAAAAAVTALVCWWNDHGMSEVWNVFGMRAGVCVYMSFLCTYVCVSHTGTHTQAAIVV